MPELRLYPMTEPFARSYLPVGDGHEIYLEQCGRPDGVPVVVLHGGPGAGCSPFMRRFFNPAVHRVVLFDQRGAGRSRPQGGLNANTTWDLVADIERIREHLGIERWQVFGGSWGSTLALLYAQAHPDRVRALMLRGIFTMTGAELDWFYGGGAARFYPEPWDAFAAPIPPDERGDMIAAYYRRLTAADEAEQMRFARPWVRWESATASLRPMRVGLLDGAQARAFARIECHFFEHRGWLRCDDQILVDMDRIAAIPGVIVQGRYDVICPPITAVRLDEAWPAASLKLVDDAGHALSEPGITQELLRATEAFATVE
ncbi:prolyl aminopeptidase [Paralimibaculum aggregatum]|uniref:Proline iminopeptidase n=1 Tax=Paralimibaculum aggregatum TaxID=3036245 RepID=A0ABQ6LQ32_9RHOB|nr:prolyl aminopeptidase [Limibaculum sp. NKW23]GMG82904.1 prolyl aminopeptidase [Limibaculum sp. NKW23]